MSNGNGSTSPVPTVVIIVEDGAVKNVIASVRINAVVIGQDDEKAVVGAFPVSVDPAEAHKLANLA